MSIKLCAQCGKQLDPDEIEYYGTACEPCERRFSNLIETQGNLGHYLQLLQQERDAIKP